ncbi:MAG: hydrogenase maturation peptidase HycI [Candidatus Omnitrophota bacterium]|nr:hydrogenase maturation peptidase HycI [Candidatus Omnitrophota bacterium]
MLSLKTALKKQLKGAKRVAVLAVGSELRGDDAAGMLVAEGLKYFAGKKLRVFLGATAPENLSGEIRRFMPTHVLIVDAADLGKKAGAISLISPQEAGGISFSTHQLPLKFLADYLQETLGCAVLLIGIQPKKITFGAPPSPAVRKSAKLVSDTIKEIIG